MIPALWLTLALALLVIAGTYGAMPSRASAATSGPRDAGAGASVDWTTQGYQTPWTNPGHITADDTNYAEVDVPHYLTWSDSEYLQGTGYGFSIPSGATINGITVQIMRYTEEGYGWRLNDGYLYLLKAGAVVGTNKASGSAWPTSMAVATYGGASDLWGTTWTPAQINASNFGVSLSAYNPSTQGYLTGYVDYMRITVAYTSTAPEISTTSPLPDGTVGAAYSQTLTATGGTPAYTWDIASGTLPAGLSLSSAGVISGTPTAAGGPTSVTFRVTDSLAAAGTRALSIAIGKGTPTITWADPADIVYGTALSGTQLNASASVAGTFVYTPASGTMLNAGNGQSLHVDFTPADTTNYNTASEDAAINAHPLTVAVTADAGGKVYGAGDPALTYTCSPALVGSDSFSGSLSRVAGENVGSYAITQGTLALSSNYSIIYVSASLAVNPKSLTITADDRGKTSGDTVVFAGTEFAAVGLVDSDNVTSVTLTSAGADASAPIGDYPIIPSAAVGTGLANYTITYVNGTLTVSTYGLTISANDFSKTYGDTVTFAGSECTVIGLLVGDTVDNVTFTSTGAAAAAAAGSHTIVPGAAQGTGLGKYTIIYVSGTLTVNPRNLTITADSCTKTYGGTVTFAGTEFAAAGLVNSDTVAGATLISLGAYGFVPVGDYAITPIAASGTGLANYTITYLAGTMTVNQRDLTVTATGVNKVYDGTTTATVNLATDALAGDSVTASYAGATFADKNVGTGQTVSVAGISISGADAANYNLTSTTASTTANITQRNLTITATGVSKVYDGTTATTVILATDAPGGDAVTASYTGAAFANKNVGIGITVSVTGISVSGADAANYNLLSTTASTTANITRRDMTVTATGVDRVYDGTTTATVILATDALGGDTVAAGCAGAAFADKNAGTGKAVSVTGIYVSGADAANYNLLSTTASATANITSAVLTITANDRGKTYGETLTFAGTEFTSAGLRTGDSVASVTLTSAGADTLASIGTYSIVPSAALGTGLTNYSITDVNGTLTVGAKALTIAANSSSKTYGDTVSFAGTEFTVVGLEAGDSVDSVTLTSTGASAAAATGSYSTVPSAALGSGLGEYTIIYVNGILTVSRAAIDWHVSSSPAGSAEGGSVTFTATFNDANATGTVTFMDGAVVLGTGTLSNGVAIYSTSALSVGNHYITASYDGDGNFYGGTTPAHVHTVQPRPVSLWLLIAVIAAAVIVILGPFLLLILLRRRREQQEAEEQA